MAKTLHDDVFDAALNHIKNNADLLTLCSAQPTTVAEATTTYKLADVVIDSADFTGPANGDTSGRKITVNQQTGVPVDTTGDAIYVALVKTPATAALLAVTSCTLQTVTSGNTCTINTFDIEIADPT